MDKIRTNTSVLKNLAENCIYSALRQINAMSEKLINQKHINWFFNLFNNFDAIDLYA